ncbi:MAG: hypothetical protein N3A69_16125 [Leptospiraceae bacterium]|nr:hypothetical protein [Leptospiraceae bacterium]
MLRIYILLVLIFLLLFWLSSKFKQYTTSKSRRVFLESNDDSEDLEKLRAVTNQLIAMEKEYSKTEIQDQLARVIDLQIEVFQTFQKNPENLTENIKRIILYYTNSIVNVLRQWLDLKKKMPNSSVVSEGNQRIGELLEKWLELLQNIRLKLLNSQYAVLDAEIQALLKGLNLDS